MGRLNRAARAAVTLLIVAGVGAFAAVARAEGYRAVGEVLRVVDGDTIDVDIDGNGAIDRALERVRLAGVSANEMNGPNGDVPECHAADAAFRVRQMLPERSASAPGARVTLTANVVDSQSRGRAVRFVATDTVLDVGTLLVAEGLALAHPHHTETRNNHLYVQTMLEARERGIALWDPDSCAAGPNDAATFRMWAEWNPPGVDDAQPVAEWIRIKNTGVEPVALNDGARVWGVRDGGQNVYRGWPTGATIDPGETVTLVVGTGTDTADTYHWGLAEPVLGNVGDGAYLVDPDGDIRASFVYPCLPACTDPLSHSLVLHANFDASGRDADQPNGEWVNVENRSDAPADLEGYVVRVRGARLVLGPGSAVGPGERLRVYAGAGRDGPLAKHLGSPTPLLDNDAGWARLERLDGVVVEEFAWPCDPCPLTRDAVIASVHYNAGGSDVDNPNGEWILLANDGANRVNLRDWQLWAPPYRFTIDGSRILRPGESLTVRIGGGEDSATTLYWGMEKGILRNAPSGDVVSLLSPYRNVKGCRAWGKTSC